MLTRPIAGGDVVDVDDGVDRLTDQRILRRTLLRVHHIDLHAIGNDRLHDEVGIVGKPFGEIGRNAGDDVGLARLQSGDAGVGFGHEIVAHRVEIGRALTGEAVHAW